MADRLLPNHSLEPTGLSGAIGRLLEPAGEFLSQAAQFEAVRLR